MDTAFGLPASSRGLQMRFVWSGLTICPDWFENAFLKEVKEDDPVTWIIEPLACHEFIVARCLP
jgi:hypothetical protein